MMSGWNTGLQAVKTRPHAGGLPRILSRLFAREAVSEVIVTRIHLDASPETVWNRIMFYEEVPGLPPFLLRTFMPHPVRTDGEKTEIGARVQCVYKGGNLVKRITDIKPPRLIQFEVIEQCLGIEGCVIAQGGSYEILHGGDGSEVVLTTKYMAYLRPRYLWRPLEKLVAGQLHQHILNGMRSCLPELPREVRLSANVSLFRASLNEEPHAQYPNRVPVLSDPTE